MNIGEILQLLGLVLPPLINAAEQVFQKPGSGAVKKAAVMDAAHQFVRRAAGSATSDEFVGRVVDDTVAAMQASGTINATPLTMGQLPPAVIPAPVPLAAPDAPPWQRHGAVMTG